MDHQKKVLLISVGILVIVLIIAFGVARMQKNDSRIPSSSETTTQKSDAVGEKNDVTDPLSVEGLSADLESEMDALSADQNSAAEFSDENDLDALDALGGEAEQL